MPSKVSRVSRKRLDPGAYSSPSLAKPIPEISTNTRDVPGPNRLLTSALLSAKRAMVPIPGFNKRPAL